MKKKQNDRKEKKLAFAGKVRFSSAKLIPDKNQVVNDSEVTLKILSGPKPPSPSLYFKGNGYISKSNMDSSGTKPQGRKHYLHALMDENDLQGVKKLNRHGIGSSSGKNPWETWENNESTKQKVQITPLKKGVSFTFSVDFENCMAWELGLLLYALRPAKNYNHKIGMGKPIGLGSVQINIKGMELISRQLRYGHDLLSTERYNMELPQDIESFRDLFKETMDPEIHAAIELLGDPSNVRHPVHYPQVRDKDIEKETFLWFVDNDKGWNDYLQTLTANSQQLPVLTRKDKLS